MYTPRIVNMILPVGTVQLTIKPTATLSIVTMDPDYLVDRTIISTSNLEMTPATVATVSLEDQDPVANPNRFILVSSNDTPHNLMRYSIYYDVLNKDMLVIPTLEMYKTISYIVGGNVTVDAYRINFGDGPVGNVPLPLVGRDVTSVLANIARQAGHSSKGAYYEKMITPVYNYSGPGMHPRLFINFGAPVAMFATLGFTVPIGLVTYASLFVNDTVSIGNRNLADVGNLVVEIPL